MTAVLLALAAVVLGFTAGLRWKNRRFLVERQRRREAEAKVDMYNLNALATDHDVIGGPVTGPSKVVELFDGARLAEWRERAEPPIEGIDAELGETVTFTGPDAKERAMAWLTDGDDALNDWADAVHGEDGAS